MVSQAPGPVNPRRPGPPADVRMPPPNRRHYTPEFRAEAIRQTQSRPIAHVARERGIPESTLRGWVPPRHRLHPDYRPTVHKSDVVPAVRAVADIHAASMAAIRALAAR